MTILKAAGTVILREETYYLEKYFEKPFGINETCGYIDVSRNQGLESRNLVEVIPREKQTVKGTEGGVLGGRMWQQSAGISFGELAEGGPGSILRWGHLFHGTMFGV